MVCSRGFGFVFDVELFRVETHGSLGRVVLEVRKPRVNLILFAFFFDLFICLSIGVSEIIWIIWDMIWTLDLDMYY